METYKILSIVLVSLAVGAALHEAFLQFTNHTVTKIFNPWTFPRQKDNWVRDGSKPPQDGEYDTMSITVLVALPFDQQGVGYWDPHYESWVVRITERSERRTDKILGWQKFPDYEKI